MRVDTRVRFQQPPSNRTQPELRSEVFELGPREYLCEDISNVFGTEDICDRDFLVFDAIPNVVESNVDVLRALMEFVICCKRDR